MRVAVTGSRGFIGQHTVRHLRERGHDVVEIGRGSDGTQQRLEDGAPLAAALVGADSVVHLAGRSVDSLDTPVSAYLGPNVELTEQVTRAAIAADVPRLVFTSSRMVYPSWLTEPLREDCAEPPDSFYGLSKLFAEEIIALHARRSGIASVALRVAQVAGPGDGGRGALPRMVEQARTDGRITISGSGAAVRDFVAVTDLVRAIELSLDRSSGSLVANIGTGGFSVLEMAQEVARQGGLGPEAVVRRPVEDEDRSVYRLDCTVAADQLSWRPEHGLADLVRERFDA
ncbi:NAD-dependent epimerase/dehydratase family protein [Nocardioides limicola]|uniref:NAD-dependent epimerase/dehydratase family protein n=1 Tax=Nocardioides limicola TaxID=2803368 RepID=UPI00193B9417|nr:NAD(P)-dependent oxidoreductase [Nocardioides sp. DJM-14]